MTTVLHLLLSVVFLTASTGAIAAHYPKPITPYINDYANLIDPETEARITKQLKKLRLLLDLELVVVTIQRRDDYGNSASIESFTKGLFNHWGIGHKTRNDGILVLISHSDREMRIELGSSYGPIYDKRMGAVIENYFLPYFRSNKYAKGIEEGIYETISRLHPTYAVTDPSLSHKPTLLMALKQTALWRFFEDKLWILIFSGIFIYLTFESRLRDQLIGLHRCPNCKYRQLHRKRTILRYATSKTRGAENIEAYCTSCDYHSSELRSLPIENKAFFRSHNNFRNETV